jgi:hypothetical protein
MTMQRRHFEMIAETLRRHTPQYPAAVAALARDFADTLARTNQRFDRARFLAACGVTEG